MKKNIVVNWKRDEDLEEFLEKNGIEFEIIEVKMSQIMPETQGRLIARDVNDDEVMRYAIQMEAGATFKQICLVPNGKEGFYDIGQGRHRHRALGMVNDDDSACIPVCYAKPKDELEKWTITVLANNFNGIPPSLAERVAQGVEMLRKHPELTQKDLAVKLGITVDKLGRAVSAEKLRDKLQNAGVRRIEKMSERSLLFLKPLQGNLTVLTTAANAALDMNLSQDDVRDLVSAIRGGQNEAAQLKVIDNAMEEHAARSKSSFRTRGQIPCDTFSRSLQRLEAFIARYSTIGALGLHTSKRRKTLTDQWRRIRDKIDEVLELS